MTDYMSADEMDELAADYKLYEAYPDDCTDAFCGDENKPAHLIAAIVAHYGEETSREVADSAGYLQTRSWRQTDKRTILADVIELRKRDTRNVSHTEVHGGQYCITHGDFALEGDDDPEVCGSGDATECDLRDLFIQTIADNDDAA
jgi:hypothetical protein